MCDKEYYKQYGKRRYESRKAAGICVSCGVKLNPKRTGFVCPACAIKRSEYHKKRKRLLKAKGICVTCGKSTARKGKSNCQQCGKRNTEREHERRQERIRKGLCSRCGQNIPKPNERLCLPCRQAVKARKWKGKHIETLQRDEFSCQLCERNRFLVVHHIDGHGEKHENPNHNLENLITLCKSCHNHLTLLLKPCTNKDLLAKLLLAH